ncbi:hypothetical protein ACWGMV_31755, partial [Streptomyces albidoflavus]
MELEREKTKLVVAEEKLNHQRALYEHMVSSNRQLATQMQEVAENNVRTLSEKDDLGQTLEKLKEEYRAIVASTVVLEKELAEAKLRAETAEERLTVLQSQYQRGADGYDEDRKQFVRNTRMLYADIKQENERHIHGLV